ncbi:hypothetical protein [Rhizobium favelukesii]|uniref:Uncharacterized protein n=1 Tax=Rhizobium favelukesii TaxID=348824 RepID=W6RSY9_9HYPH|nr:hypothetical protein [Rhizobium favelukesii]MCS0459303.1 hypothetical protein [Rhizobium favelukesii]CDM57396.1 putative predicted protein [Rhizobium favelukesii]
MNVEIILAGVAASAVLAAYFADKKHRKAKAAAKLATKSTVKPPRWVDSGPIHAPRPAAAPIASGYVPSAPSASAVATSTQMNDDNMLTQMLVTAIVIDSMTPDTPAASSSHDSGSSWSSSDSGSSSYDSGSSSSSYDSGSSSSYDSGGGGGW